MASRNSFEKHTFFSPANGADDREAYQKNWVAVYTRPRSEKKAAEELNKAGIEVYLPIQKQIRQWSDRKKSVVVVVIPLIVFAYLSINELLTLKKHPLVQKILSRPGEKDAAVIPMDEIDKLKFILGQSDSPVSFDAGVFSVKNTVRVTRGPLMGLHGTVMEYADGSSELVVSIDFLGGARLKIQKSDLELLK